MGEGDEDLDGPVGGWLYCGGVDRADGRRAVVLEYVDRDLLPASMTGWTFGNVSGQVVNLAVPVLGFVLASRRPANPIGWLFLTAGLVLALDAFGAQYALRALVAAPGSLPAGRALAWFSNWSWVIPFVMLTFVFLLFPTGHLRSRRWRPAAWSMAAVFALAAVVVACHRHPLLVAPVHLVQ